MAQAAPHVIAGATELVVRYGAQVVLDRASLTIQEGERIGLLGRNGCGKSTFLRIAAGALEPDSGIFTRRREHVTSYLPQVFDLDGPESVHANILAGARHVLELLAEYERIPAESPHSATLLDRIDHFDGWNLEHRIRSLITHLHSPEAERRVDTLSGGEKRRVALCRALLAQPDFLLLDEPTNHLDTRSIEWLEDFLERYPGACLFVTHDRYFLDRIATRIVELTRGQFVSYEGTYSDYLLAKAARQGVEEEQERKRQKFLKKELEWVRRGPRARRTKSVDRIERYFQMAGENGPEQEIEVDLVIPPAPKLANRVLELRHLGFDLPDGRTLFDDLSFDLPAGARLGVVGRNGAGKSTLLRVILGESPPTRGEVALGLRTRINYVDQNRILLDDQKTVWEEVGEGLEYVALGEERITLRAYLRRFLFTEDRINSRISLLSGGERSRILLAKILKRGGNLIILDEPTNDLDLATLRLLEEALLAFTGSVIVVSHDRFFLNRICTHTLAFEVDGSVALHVGNYDYYLEKHAGKTVGPIAADDAAPPKHSPPAGKPRKLKWKEERELEGMESTILAAEEEVSRIELLMAEADWHARPVRDWQTVEGQLQTARDRVAHLYERWEKLTKVAQASRL